MKILILIINLISFIKSQDTSKKNTTTTVKWQYNSSTCETMKNNGTIDIDCFNATACCFYQYTYNNNTFTQCEKKKNNTAQMCKYLPDVVTYFGGSMSICSCQGVFIGIIYLLLTFIIGLII